MVNIISYSTGHDSAITYVANGELVASIEGEKNSHARFYKEPTLDNAFDWLHRVNQITPTLPDVICLSGWDSSNHEVVQDKTGVYLGLDYKEVVTRSIFGKKIDFFYTTHEKAHIYMSYALSPFPQGQPVYCLLWEGAISAYYKIDKDLGITKLSDVIPSLGEKYSFLFVLAGLSNAPNLDAAGKIMALASYAKKRDLNKYRELVDYLLLGLKEVGYYPHVAASLKEDVYKKFGSLVPYNQGICAELTELAWAMQERVLEIFFSIAQNSEKIPLIISGGCGLNCYWNQKIKDSNIFEDVFVPPCTNDSGIAIGLAAEAQFHFSGNAKLKWDVYAGEEVEQNLVDTRGFVEVPLDYQQLAKNINEGKVVAWMQGRYEIGPRALCNRSLLAAPFSAETLERLNKIKSREMYRPIAPVCREEDAEELFGVSQPSPYMLYFSMVRTSALKTVTHVDGTARVQTVNAQQNTKIHNLLTEFKKLSGYGVLCNTSLNFNGKGFINNTRDAFKYARERGLDGLVIGEKYFLKNNINNCTPIGYTHLKNYDSAQNCLVFNVADLIRDVIHLDLELTDWSLQSALILTLCVQGLSGLDDVVKVGLRADNKQKNIYDQQIGEFVEIKNNEEREIEFIFNKDPQFKGLITNISNLRLVIDAAYSLPSSAKISLSEIRFLNEVIVDGV